MIVFTELGIRGVRLRPLEGDIRDWGVVEEYFGSSEGNLYGP
jgi:hypothetical protein